MKPMATISNKGCIFPKPIVAFGRAPRRRTSTGAFATAESYVAPSSRTGANELEALSRFSEVVPDVLLNQTLQTSKAQAKAATSSRSVLAGIMGNPAGFGRMKFAIEQARYYSHPDTPAGDAHTALQVDKALVNVGTIMLEGISGRVSTEIDPRLANDAEKLIARGRQLVALYADSGISCDKIVLRMPATWAAIQATKILETEGIACHLISVFSFVQAVAAVQAGASVIQINVGRLADWYDRNPGVIYDATAPREARAMAKAGYGAALANPGILLTEKVYSYIKQRGADKTKVMASGLRTKAEALSVSGVDFLVIGPRVLDALQSSITLEGYNDGLHAGLDAGITAAFTKESAAAYEFSSMEVADVNGSVFEDQIGMAGQELLNESVKRLIDDANRLEPLFLNQAGGQE